jgi:hypothetical protein
VGTLRQAVFDANQSGATWADGDLNDDNVVDEVDLVVAFEQFGLDLVVVG